MNTTYEFDYILIGILLLGIIIGVYQIFQEKEKVTTPKGIYFFLVIGFLLVVLAVVSNGLFEHKWENRYIFSFLLLKRVSGGWFFRHMCAIGYFFLSLGVELLIVYARNKRTKK